MFFSINSLVLNIDFDVRFIVRIERRIYLALHDGAYPTLDGRVIHVHILGHSPRQYYALCKVSDLSPGIKIGFKIGIKSKIWTWMRGSCAESSTI